MRAFLTGLLLAAATAGPVLADPTGSWLVKGGNADGSGAYQGKISITRDGETYKAIWVVGSTKFTGTGIGGAVIDGLFTPAPASESDSAISILFRSGKDVGLAVYSEQADGSWSGAWTYENLNRVAYETWTPKDGQTPTKTKTATVKTDTKPRAQAPAAPKP
ncbi:hypothetical protein M2360_004390 [Rhizobium sp. SG_E_25_P2]|uniref:hypothetical protein n=1 Tax=Rhizobium sp. SG_E_25_P2 TaxID=2879942 RepID=UPI0024735E20|nr:hypothetical protein [Rhizobium sp. SG_E_25_P2]MDH6268970.1 hypothetical protein [Rhizobium sp. SG_E_25_P2]